MRYILVFAVTFICFSLHAQRVRVKLSFTYTDVYCGGAPPEENLQRNAEKKYAGKMVMIVREQNNRVDSLKTDSLGSVNLRLKKGTYRVYEAWRYYLNIPGDQEASDFDLKCLHGEWQKTIYRIEVARKKAKIVAMDPIRVYCSWNYPCLKESEPPPGRGQ